MPTSDLLLRYAVANTWVDPEQDKQFILVGTRMHRPRGVRGLVKMFARQFALPTPDAIYHVFNAGRFTDLSSLGLLYPNSEFRYDTWMAFSDSMNAQNLMVDLFTAAGEQLTRFNSYFMLTREGAFVFCVQANPKFAMDFRSNQIYLRLYSNFYYRYGQALGEDDFIYCTGHTNITYNQRLAIQAQWVSHNARAGKVLSFVNGYLVENLLLSQTKNGDTVEMVYDGSISEIKHHAVLSLAAFTSTIDSIQKYLIFDSQAAVDDPVRYVDDSDYYVQAFVPTDTTLTTPAVYKGYYLGGITSKIKRQITHRDHSVSASALEYVGLNLKADLEEDYSAFAQSTPLSVNQMQLTVIHRYAGPARTLGFDASRMRDLFWLDAEQRKQAMVGVNSVLPQWRAAALEANEYNTHLKTPFHLLDADNLMIGFGYSAVSSLVGMTPQKTYINSGRAKVDLPDALHFNSTCYEYDANGFLIGSNHHSSGPVYSASVENTLTCDMVEAVYGQATFRPDNRFGFDEITVPQDASWRLYMCRHTSGVPDEVWEDVTDSNRYLLIDNVVHWVDTSVTNQFLCVRTDLKFLEMNLSITPVDGLLYFTLAQEEDLGSGFVSRVLSLPYGHYDLWINGKSAVRGLDYHLDFPRVVVTNRSYLVDPVGETPQNLRIRCYGFCKPDMTPDDVEDTGFIKHGYLSNNNRFDLRQDKVLRIVVDGSLKHRDDIEFSEEHSGAQIAHVDNGKPYQIKDIWVPMTGFSDSLNTYTLRQEALTSDKAVSDYLSTLLPEPDRGNINVIANKHPVVSPFFARITALMKNEVLTDAVCSGLLTDEEIVQYVEPYVYLLQVDPVNSQMRPDLNFCVIYAHPFTSMVAVSTNQMRVLARLVWIYARGLISLSSHFTLSS